MVAPKLSKLAARVLRARSAIGHAITYKLGKGGFDPASPLPSTGTRQCDCSGFVAWVLGLSRQPKPSRDFWVETSAMVADAHGAKIAFAAINKPVPGCVVVYGDKLSRQGHCGIVTEVKFTDGRITIHGIDCSSGQSRLTGSAITERDLTFFIASNPTFALLVEDFA